MTRNTSTSPCRRTRNSCHPTRRGHTVFAYVIEGQGYFCQEKNPFSYEVEGVNYFDMQREPFVGNEMLVLFGDGDQIMVTTEAEAVRFLLVSGKPIGEPVAWYGPIVMNTEEELRVAFEEYQNGTFIKAKEIRADSPVRPDQKESGFQEQFGGSIRPPGPRLNRTVGAGL